MGFVGARSYELWQKGPWDLPKPAKAKVATVSEEPKKEISRQQLVSTKNIIDKNLFDPERGAGRTQETEASAAAVRRIRSMVLMGTVILGSSRYAILRSPSDSPPSAAKSPAGQPDQLRLRLGDTVEGFKLSEIQERKVVFSKGSSQVEVALDFFRKGEQPAQSPAGAIPPTPGVAPGIPRRQNLPAPPVPQ